MIRKHHQPGKKQAGLGLIDVMVAVFIFSVGILAIAALQLISKQSNFEAIQRSNASTMAFDILERMRMNSDYVSSTTGSTLSYYVGTGTTTLDYGSPLGTPTLDCSVATCSKVQLATWDLYDFQQLLLGSAELNSNDNSIMLGGLVDPTACISGPATGDGIYTITIVWRGQSSLPNNNANTCGTGLYNDGTDVNAFRRIIEIKSYMH